jgi:hypothetical protein
MPFSLCMDQPSESVCAVYTHEEFLASYKDHVYLLYCIILLLIIIVHHTIYRSIIELLVL